MTNVYKMKLFRWPNLKNSEKYVAFCLDNNKLGWGWPDKTEPNKIKKVCRLRDYYHTLDEEHFDNLSGLKTALNRIEPTDEKPGLQKGDFVWVYGAKTIDNNDKKYYLGKVTGDTFICGHYQKEQYPEIGMLKDCEWKQIDDDDVPGVVTSFCRADGTIRQLNNPNFVNYCEYLYNNKTPFPPMDKDEQFFWELTHPEDLEDIVGIYLQTKGYYIFPSTNKQGTKDYEFKLIHLDGEKEAIIQCKNNAVIKKNLWDKFETGDYKEYNVYVLTILDDPHPQQFGYKPHYDNDIIQWSLNDRIMVLNKSTLYTWAGKNCKILPNRIQTYLKISGAID